MQKLLSFGEMESWHGQDQIPRHRWAKYHFDLHLHNPFMGNLGGKQDTVNHFLKLKACQLSCFPDTNIDTIVASVTTMRCCLCGETNIHAYQRGTDICMHTMESLPIVMIVLKASWEGF